MTTTNPPEAARIVQGSLEWNRQLSLLIRALGSDAFSAVFIETLRLVAPFNQMVAINYQSEAAPTFCCSYLPNKNRQAVIDQYLNGCYLLDPWYHAFKRGLKPGIYTLEDVAPDNFFKSEFFKLYYRSINVEQEVVIAFNLGDSGQLQISMGFPLEDFYAGILEKLSDVSSVIDSIILHHLNNKPEPTKDVSELKIIHDHVSKVLHQFGSECLTNRERDLAIMIIRGYSLKAAADHLGVALGTVKVHCKNVYRKLDINSQSGLFGLFLEALSDESQIEPPGPGGPR